MALPIVVYGSHTCEDTAFVRNRLHALDIPFVERDKEDDPEVARMLDKYSPGAPRTPTVVFGKSDIVLVEPTVRQLEEALVKAGHTFTAPRAVQFGNLLSGRVSPAFRLPSSRGEEFDLNQLRGWRRAVLLFGHEAGCLADQGYARQLAKDQSKFEEAEARPVFVLQTDADQARWWSAEFAGNAETLADASGSVKSQYVEYYESALGAHVEGTLLLVLDLYAAPRAGLYARDAGGQLSPDEVASWLELLEYECDE